MVLETWALGILPEQSDPTIRVTYTVYNRIGILLKSLLSVSRITPAYKLSRRQGPDSYVICYRTYTGDPQLHNLGDCSTRRKYVCPAAINPGAKNTAYSAIHRLPLSAMKKTLATLLLLLVLSNDSSALLSYFIDDIYCRTDLLYDCIIFLGGGCNEIVNWIRDDQLLMSLNHFPGDNYKRVRVGQLCTPVGTIQLSVSYRTKMTISPTQNSRDSILLKSDHFHTDLSPRHARYQQWLVIVTWFWFHLCNSS